MAAGSVGKGRWKRYNTIEVIYSLPGNSSPGMPFLSFCQVTKLQLKNYHPGLLLLSFAWLATGHDKLCEPVTSITVRALMIYRTCGDLQSMLVAVSAMFGYIFIFADCEKTINYEKTPRFHSLNLGILMMTSKCVS